MDIDVGETVNLIDGKQGMELELAQAGLFQFDLDYDAKTLTINQLK